MSAQQDRLTVPKGFAVSHNNCMPYLYPIRRLQVHPYFPGKDGLDIDPDFVKKHTPIVA